MGQPLSLCREDGYATSANKKVPHFSSNRRDFEGNAYVVLTGCNYDSPECRRLSWGPIDQFVSAKFMKKIVQHCPQVADYRTVFQEQMTKQNVLNAIYEMGSRCEPGDCFVLYYAGHGDRLKDVDGDEEDGYDEALVCLNPITQSPEPRNDKIWIRDDELASAITSVVDEEVAILVLADCCHSGSMMDLQRECWEGYKCLTISGCADKQVSRGEGKGSYFSHSLSAAYEVLQNDGMDGYMASEVYNNIIDQFRIRYRGKSDQTISISMRGIRADQFPWPLCPNVSVVGEGGTGGVINYDYHD